MLGELKGENFVSLMAKTHLATGGDCKGGGDCDDDCGHDPHHSDNAHVKC